MKPIRLTKEKKSKYGNKITEFDGMKFASKHEVKRFAELRLMERAGLIRKLKQQVPFELIVGIIKIGTYIADHVYEQKIYDCTTHNLWVPVVEDAKGVRTDVYKIKKKLMQAIYGIEIKEV
ncbi:MAG: DUF1064 domain-containing protein [Gammaproteobacteria bacterium]|nr:DUF1064 domain-containing protein [Gammaproteobacteria bacterium]